MTKDELWEMLMIYLRLLKARRIRVQDIDWLCKRRERCDYFDRMLGT